MSSPFSTPHLLFICCSVDDAVVEETETEQNHSSGPDVKFQSTLDHMDQQQQDRQELEDELLDLDLEDKPLHQDKHKVSHNLCFLFLNTLIINNGCLVSKHHEK